MATAFTLAVTACKHNRRNYDDLEILLFVI